MAMLEVKDLEVYYGMIQAIKGISFEVNQGEVVALIGANGAGKTTTLHTITGLLPSKKGTVTFEGQDITKVPAHKIVYMGVAHVPEGRRVFADLSVYQNLKMGAYTRKDKEEIEQTDILKCSCNTCFVDVNRLLTCNILAIQFDNSLIWLIHTCQKVEYRCFTGSVRSDQSVKFPFFDLHFKPVYCTQSSEGNGQIFYI